MPLKRRRFKTKGICGVLVASIDLHGTRDSFHLDPLEAIPGCKRLALSQCLYHEIFNEFALFSSSSELLPIPLWAKQAIHRLRVDPPHPLASSWL